ncbi:MAG: outer membrane protein assembly factor BamA [Spirochaetales bacterium]|nr:outer membrane protein assembly factor BamA [Spirochaetales bacterium]
MRKLLIIALIIIAPSIITAQEDSSWFIDKPIQDFTFKGLKYVEFSELEPLFRNYIGQGFTFELFSDLQDKLYALDKFDYIEGNAEPGDENKNSVVIVFTVEEKPVITSIVFEGNSSISRNDLLDQVLIKIGDFKDDALLRVDEESIRSYYLEKGFDGIIVDAESKIDEEDQGISVYFKISEGNKTSIKEIQFVGNTYASASTLRGQLKSKKQDLFNSGIFLESNLELDKDLIRNYYRKFGFVDISIDRVERQNEADPQTNRSYLILVFYINEGIQYTFGDVNFEGNVIFTEDELRKYIYQKENTLFNKVEWQQSIEAIKSLYADNGYIYNQFFVNENRDEDNKTISYNIKIVEKDKAHIENIIITGNEKTSKEVILRELPFEVGDIFSVEKIRKGYLNLNNLQYFSAIDIQTPQGSSEGLMDLVINVTEQSWADFKFALTFSGDEFPVSGTIGWSDRNVFGQGITLGVDTEASPIRQGLSFKYQDNYLFGKGFGLGASLSFYHNLIQNAMEDVMAPIFETEDIPDPYTSVEEYNQALSAGTTSANAVDTKYDSYDLSLSGNTGYFKDVLFGRLGISTGLSTAISYIWYDQNKFRPYSSTVRDNYNTFRFIDTWGTTLYWDNRDIYYNPENGNYLSQYIQFAGGFLLGDRHYIKLKTRAEAFLTLFKIPVLKNWDFQTVLAIHSAIGFVLPNYDLFGGECVIQATEREKLYIDGMSTARGWSPVWDGESMLDFSVELRHPLIKEYIWWTWFFDGAALWPDREDIASMKLDDFYFSFGGGIKLSIPGIPLRLYLAQRFKFNDNQLEWIPGDINFGDNGMGFKFVVAITQPGGF